MTSSDSKFEEWFHRTQFNEASKEHPMLSRSYRLCKEWAKLGWDACKELEVTNG